MKNFVFAAFVVFFLGTFQIFAESGTEQSLHLAEIYTAKLANSSPRIVAPYVDSIYKEFGILIPTELMTEYSGIDGPNSPLTEDEIEIVRETLRMVPNAGEIIQLIIPVRTSDPEAIPGGSFLDYQWPFFLNPGDYEGFPKDYFLSDMRAVILMLPVGVAVSDSLPEIKPDSNLLTPELMWTYQEFPLKQEMEIPWTTYGERLQQALIHEIGHGLLAWAALDQSGSVRTYWERQGFTLVGWNTRDTSNPLLVSFANVNGWRLFYFSDYIESLMLNLPEESQTSDFMIWDRDPNVWAYVPDRVIRLNPYASYGPIQEAFPEFWMASILYPEFLTEGELDFFSEVKESLENGSFPNINAD